MTLSEQPDLSRVLIIGTTSTGKSTLGVQLADRLGVPFVEMDALFWGPDWTQRPKDEFLAAVEQASAEENWVMAGNYTSWQRYSLDRATTIIWLDYSFPRTFWRCLKRTCIRVFTRQQLFSGNREGFRKSFLSRDSIIVWLFKTWGPNRQKFAELLEAESGSRIELIFRNPNETNGFLETL